MLILFYFNLQIYKNYYFFTKFLDGGGVIHSTINIEWVCTMKLEKFKEKDTKKKVIIVFTMCCIFLLVGVFLYTSFAVFTENKDFNIINGRYQDPGDIYFAYYVDGEITRNLPTQDSGYMLDEENSKYAHIKKDKEESLRTNRDTERRIRLARSVPNLDFCTLKRNNQEEINFIYALKKECYKNYVEEWNEEIQKKLFERYIKENGKHIKIITLKGEKIGFFDGKNIDNDIFEINNICISLEYQNKGIETAILEEILFENKDKKVKLQCFKSNPAISLYNKLGFQMVGETKSHYEMEK